MNAQLAKSCEQLIRIVDGKDDAGWESNPGEPVRLKDTPEWCAFYSAFHAWMRNDRPCTHPNVRPGGVCYVCESCGTALQP
jgi:hypothetical protein